MLYCILGKKGHGKSTWIKNYIKNNFHEKFLIYDYNYEYNEFQKYDNIEFFENINDILSRGVEITNVNIIIEEFHSLNHEDEDRISHIIRIMRHYNLQLFLISHRIYDMNPFIRNQIDYLIFFRMQEKRDKDFLLNFIDIENLNFNLKPFEYYFYNTLQSKIYFKGVKK